jgi:hypothetical protein
MTDKATLLALAERVEGLDGRNVNGDMTLLTNDIARALGWHRVEPRFTRNKRGAWIAPGDFLGVYDDGSPRLDSLHGTEMHPAPPLWLWSLDAAMALVREGWAVLMAFSEQRAVCDVHTAPLGQHGTWPAHASAATPALALCAAALRARAETQP